MFSVDGASIVDKFAQSLSPPSTQHGLSGGITTSPRGWRMRRSNKSEIFRQFRVFFPGSLSVLLIGSIRLSLQFLDSC